MEALFRISIRLQKNFSPRPFIRRQQQYRRINNTSITSPDDQIFKLPDGRTLAYTECGNLKGYPLLFFHGYPSSRLEGFGLHEIGLRHGLRIISPDRPGFGLSSPQLGRRILHWPADVQSLAQHLELSKFAILGGSGGGPYAIACAYALPKEMLSAIGVMAGSAPWEAGTEGLPLRSRVIASLAKYAPFVLRVAFEVTYASMKKISTTGIFTRQIDEYIRQNREKDSTETVEEIRDRIARMAFEAFAQGCQASVDEAKLLSGDWGFKLENTKFPRIQISHGSLDENAPVRMTRWMAERIPDSVLREFEGDNHFTLALYHLEDIITDLVREIEANSPELKSKKL